MSVTNNNSDVYSPARAAELFGLAESRLRYWAQTGFVGPSVRRGGRFFYTFPDLVALKVAKDLLDRGVSMQRVRKNLDALRARLPAVERPLSQLRICSDGDELLVVDDGVAFQPTSGQLVMSFAVSSIQDRLGEPAAEERLAVVRPITPPIPVPIEPEKTEPDSAWRAFQAGLAAADAGEPARAATCYRRALELDPAFAAAHTNLANAEEAGAGHRGLARAAYEKALEPRPRPARGPLQPGQPLRRPRRDRAGPRRVPPRGRRTAHLRRRAPQPGPRPAPGRRRRPSPRPPRAGRLRTTRVA